MFLYLASDWSKPSLSVFLLAAIYYLASATPVRLSNRSKKLIVRNYRDESWLPYPHINTRLNISSGGRSNVSHRAVFTPEPPWVTREGILASDWSLSLNTALDSDWLLTLRCFSTELVYFEIWHDEKVLSWIRASIALRYCLLSSVVLCEVWISSLIEDVSVYISPHVSQARGRRILSSDWSLGGH